jgi:hypothetical protein
MFGFISEELVWAIRREREEEVRSINPHTTPKPDPERAVHGPDSFGPAGIWIAPALRANSAGGAR